MFSLHFVSKAHGHPAIGTAGPASARTPSSPPQVAPRSSPQRPLRRARSSPASARTVAPTSVPTAVRRVAAARVEWVTCAKAVGIILVVFAHSVFGEGKAAGRLPRWLTIPAEACYAFHMPLFFFLSGLFIERSVRRPVGQFLVTKSRQLLYPYVLWTLIQAAVAAWFVRYTNTVTSFAPMVRRMAYAPQMQFWFLYVLMACMLAYRALRTLRLPPAAILLPAVAMYLSLLSPGDGLVALQRLMSPAAVPVAWPALYQLQLYFVFFAAGAALSDMSMLALPRLRAALLPLPALGFIVVVALVDRRSYGAPGTVAALATSVLGIAGALGVAVGLSRVARRTPWLRWLAVVGEGSMIIYVAHVLAAVGARVLLHRAFHAQGTVLGVAVATVAGVALPLLLDRLARRVGFKHLVSL